MPRPSSVTLERSVLVQRHVDLPAVAGDGLVDAVVDDLVREVIGPRGVGVHAGAAAHRLEACEYFDVGGVVRSCHAVMSGSVRGRADSSKPGRPPRVLDSRRLQQPHPHRSLAEISAAIPGLALAVLLAAACTFAATSGGRWLFATPTSPVSPVLVAIVVGAAARQPLALARGAGRGLALCRHRRAARRHRADRAAARAAVAGRAQPARGADRHRVPRGGRVRDPAAVPPARCQRRELTAAYGRHRDLRLHGRAGGGADHSRERGADRIRGRHRDAARPVRSRGLSVPRARALRPRADGGRLLPRHGHPRHLAGRRRRPAVRTAIP